MTYYDLLSIVKSGKREIPMQNSSESFFVPSKPPDPFIAPRFKKQEYPTEKPSIVLVQAIAASGKTTTANALSFDSKMPILDLAKHEAVGSKTLNGILPDAYPHDKISEILLGFKSGTFGVIIDGIDEARFRVKEAGFEAFLNNLLSLSKDSRHPVIIVFGRSQVLLSTWYYLGSNGADVGLIEIKPFDLDDAKKYIDSQMELHRRRQEHQFTTARDQVLDRLSTAFRSTERSSRESTLSSFVGYPPVLDAIVTLLQHTQNYYNISQALDDGAVGGIETDLLIRISKHLLERDRNKEAVSDFFDAMLDGHPRGTELRTTLYSLEEQCARIIAKSLSREFPHRVIPDGDELSSAYEESADAWCSVHPFLRSDEDTIRNPVFSAVAVMYCMLSDVPVYRELAGDYTTQFLPTYHLVHIVNRVADGRVIDVSDFNMLIQSCSDHLSLDAEIHIDVDGDAWNEGDASHDRTADLTIELLLPGRNDPDMFRFRGTVGDSVSFGPYLINAKITLPCDVTLSSSSIIETIGSCSISARRVDFATPELIVRKIPHRYQSDQITDTGLYVIAGKIGGHTDSVLPVGGQVDLMCERHGTRHPLARHVTVVPNISAVGGDQAYWEKHLRLRKILLSLASHSRGGLAKYKEKIENRRVLRPEVSDIGERVLKKLRKKGILKLDGVLYRFDAVRGNEFLGISWQQLRRYETTDRVIEFLSNV